MTESNLILLVLTKIVVTLKVRFASTTSPMSRGLNGNEEGLRGLQSPESSDFPTSLDAKVLGVKGSTVRINKNLTSWTTSQSLRPNRFRMVFPLGFSDSSPTGFGPPLSPVVPDGLFHPPTDSGPRVTPTGVSSMRQSPRFWPWPECGVTRLRPYPILRSYVPRPNSRVGRFEQVRTFQLGPKGSWENVSPSRSEFTCPTPTPSSSPELFPGCFVIINKGCLYGM